MTRLVLCAVLCGSTIVLALVSTAIQSRNRERGIALDSLKRECDMLEAINGDRCERILSIDWRRLPKDPGPSPHPIPVERRPSQ